jgi:hypothetical protein
VGGRGTLEANRRGSGGTRGKLWGNLLRIALSAATLYLLLREVGGRAVVQVLRAADLGPLLLAWLLFLLGVVVRTFRWRALLHGLGLRPPFWRLLKLYLVGGFFNAFLPSGFGGDVVRVLELAQGDRGRRASAAVGTVFVDRLTGILSLMALGLVMLPFAGGLAPWLRWTFLGVALTGLVGGGVLLDGRLVRAITARLPGALSLAGEGRLAQVYAAVTDCGARAIWQALALSTVFNLLNVAVHWLCGVAVGIEVGGGGFYFVAVPLLSLALLLPLSVGGLGARDWVAQLLFDAVAVPDAQAAGMSLSVYAVSAAAGLIGGAIYLVQGVRGLFREAQVDGA